MKNDKKTESFTTERKYMPLTNTFKVKDVKEPVRDQVCKLPQARKEPYFRIQ